MCLVIGEVDVMNCKITKNRCTYPAVVGGVAPVLSESQTSRAVSAVAIDHIRS